MSVPDDELLDSLHSDRRKNDVEWRLLVVSRIDAIQHDVAANLKSIASLQNTVAETHTIMQTLARMDERMSHLQEDVTKIRVEYVRIERYLHVERVVFGLSAALALGIVGVILPKILALS